VTKNLTLQKVINLIITMTKSTETLDSILQKFVDLLRQELNISDCVIQSFDQANIDYTDSIYPDLLEIANIVINQEQNYLTKGQYVIKSSSFYLAEKSKNLPIFTFIIFPLICQDKYLGNLLFFQQKNNYNWTKEEIELGQFMAIHSAIAIYQNQLERENNYLKQEKIIILKTAYISHELRTPVSAIVGFSKIILKEIYGSLNLKQKDYLTRIVNSGEYLLELVNDLLDLFKLNTQKEVLKLTNINLKTLCQQAIMMIEAQAKNKGLDVIFIINTPVETLIGDQRRLTQILINLLSNSVKFTNQGSITLKISSENNQFSFSVIDTGIGIKKEDQTKLFQPFQQLSNHLNQNLIQNEKGTGLGLALSQQLALLHGGKITCISEVNRGSCFTLYLPIK